MKENNNNNDDNLKSLQINEVSSSINTKATISEISNNQQQYASGFTGTTWDFSKTKDRQNPPLPVILNENIEKSIEECEQYNKLMWAKYSGRLTENNNGPVSKKIKSFWGEREESFDEKETEAYNKHKKDFKPNNCTVENFKYQCAFYNKSIDEFIDKHHLIPPERKRAASIFFYVLMGLAIVFLGFCIFAPGLLISLAAILGISTIIAAQIINASYVLASTIALIFFKLGRYVSWKQNDYEKPFEIGKNENEPVINEYPESYSKYNEELERHKVRCVGLTGEQFKTEEF